MPLHMVSRVDMLLLEVLPLTLSIYQVPMDYHGRVAQELKVFYQELRMDLQVDMWRLDMII